jgi:hypothetical protein
MCDAVRCEGRAMNAYALGLAQHGAGGSALSRARIGRRAGVAQTQAHAHARDELRRPQGRCGGRAEDVDDAGYGILASAYGILQTRMHAGARSQEQPGQSSQPVALYAFPASEHVAASATVYAQLQDGLSLFVVRATRRYPPGARARVIHCARSYRGVATWRKAWRVLAAISRTF